jgi:hypothetical protein
MTFKVESTPIDGGDELVLSFGEETNIELSVKNLKLKGGEVLLISGTAIAAGFAICKLVYNMYNTVAVFDNEIDEYVVCFSKCPDYTAGDVYKDD